MRALRRLFCRKRILPWLAVASLCLGMIWALRTGILKNTPPETLHPLSLQYGFTLKNVTGRRIYGVRFVAAAPVKQTVTQKCRRIVSSHDFRLSRDRFGNQSLRFENLDFAPRAIKIITVKVHLLIATRARAAARDIEPGYLVAEKYIECDHADIRQLAVRLKGRQPSDTAAALFSWVRGGIRYAGYTKTRRGALFTLRGRRGDCTGQADLFVALCRASGIPARCLAGYICSRSKVLDPRQYHNWAEFYFNGSWHLSDPQAGIFRQRQSDYIALRIMGPAGGREKGEGSGFDKFAISNGDIQVRMNLGLTATSGRAV